MAKAININIIGKPIATPAKAAVLTPLPIKILSTMLYKAFTNMPIMAGIENLTNNFNTFSSPNCFDLSKLLLPSNSVELLNINFIITVSLHY
jgi:hypothetical protein